MWLPLTATAHLTQFVFHFHSQEHLTEQSFPERSCTGARISRGQSSIRFLTETKHRLPFSIQIQAGSICAPNTSIHPYIYIYSYVNIPISLVSSWRWGASCNSHWSKFCVSLEDSGHKHELNTQQLWNSPANEEAYLSSKYFSLVFIFWPLNYDSYHSCSVAKFSLIRKIFTLASHGFAQSIRLKFK